MSEEEEVLEVVVRPQLCEGKILIFLIFVLTK